MKQILILLIVFVVGFSLGYAGNTLMSLQKAFYSKSNTTSTAGAGNSKTEETSGPVTENTSSAPKEPVKIPVNALSDTQKALLSKLGIDPTTFVVTPEMVTCAEDTLGSARVSEIIAGGTPSALEAVRLSPCLNK